MCSCLESSQWTMAPTLQSINAYKITVFKDQSPYRQYWKQMYCPEPTVDKFPIGNTADRAGLPCALHSSVCTLWSHGIKKTILEEFWHRFCSSMSNEFKYFRCLSIFRRVIQTNKLHENSPLGLYTLNSISTHRTGLKNNWKQIKIDYYSTNEGFHFVLVFVLRSNYFDSLRCIMYNVLSPGVP